MRVWLDSLRTSQGYCTFKLGKFNHDLLNFFYRMVYFSSLYAFLNSTFYNIMLQATLLLIVFKIKKKLKCFFFFLRLWSMLNNLQWFWSCSLILVPVSITHRTLFSKSIIYRFYKNKLKINIFLLAEFKGWRADFIGWIF